MNHGMYLIHRDDSGFFLIDDGCDAFYWGDYADECVAKFETESDAHLLMRELGLQDTPYIVLEY